MFCLNQGLKGKRHWGLEIKSILIILFEEFFGTPEFSMSLNDGSLEVEDFMLWVHAGTVALLFEIVDMLTKMSQYKTSE